MKEEDGMSILDVSFHDTLSDSRRVAPYRDYHSLTMAALGDRVRPIRLRYLWQHQGNSISIPRTRAALFPLFPVSLDFETLWVLASYP